MKRSDFMILSLLFGFIFGCETRNYKYEKIVYDMSNKTLTLDENSNFVIDSVVMTYTNETIYSLKIKNMSNGKKQINFYTPDSSYVNHINELSKLDKLCGNAFKDKYQGISIWIRHKNYHYRNLYLDRDSIQRFSYYKLPCDTLKIELDAFKRR